jgi:hypothetical protein
MSKADQFCGSTSSTCAISPSKRTVVFLNGVWVSARAPPLRV